MAAEHLGFLRCFAGWRVRKQTLAVCAFALAVYGFQSLAWPLHAGRDAQSMLMYHRDFWRAVPESYATMTYRVPIPPLVVGTALDIGGPLLAEMALSILFAASIGFWFLFARRWGVHVAMGVAVLITSYPAYGWLFHSINSDGVFAATFAAWLYTVGRAVDEGTIKAFLRAGVAAGVMSMARHAGPVFLLMGFLPLLLACHPLRARLALIAAYVLPVVVVLTAWSVHNGIRYRAFAVSRPSYAFFPYWRAFVETRIVAPGNGPASRQLAEAVRSELLANEPYKSYGVDEKTFFSSGNSRMWEDTVFLCDKMRGWDNRYKWLKDVAIEAVRANPRAYARDVYYGFLGFLLAPSSPPIKVAPVVAKDLAAGTNGLAAPTEGQAIPYARYTWRGWNPDHPALSRERLVALTEGYRREGLMDPRRHGRQTPGQVLWIVQRMFPPMATWIVVGLVGLCVVRLAGWQVLLAGTVVCVCYLFVTVLAVPSSDAYRMPCDPVFMLFGCQGLLALAGKGRHRTAASGNASL
jgi:hypothetical protein